MKFLKAFVVVFIFFTLSNALARQQYGASLGMNRCTTCHISPTGGGLRNSTGKAFGQYGYRPVESKYANNEIFSADLRAVYFKPDYSDQNRGGLALMNATVGFNYPILQAEKSEDTEIRLAYSHNLGGFGGSTPQDAFIRWRFFDDSQTSLMPQYILLGRFHLPFGIMSDEHRTYVRMQNNSTWNDYDMGVLFSGNPTESIHYDFGLINGQKTAGATVSAGGAQDWGGSANLRFAPMSMPFTLGASYAQHNISDPTGAPVNNPESFAGYLLFNVQKLWSKAPVVVSYEYQKSWNWNPSSIFPGRYISPTSGYAGTVADADSVGQLLRIDYKITERLNLIYKYDSLLLNKNFSGDTYVRHGLGARYAMGPNMLLNFRYEIADGGSNVDIKEESLALQDSIWAVLQVSF